MTKLIIKDLIEVKVKVRAKRKFVLTTASDKRIAKVAEEIGVDIVLVWSSTLEHTNAHLPETAVQALAQFRPGVEGGQYPTDRYCAKMKHHAYAQFMLALAENEDEV